MNLEEWFQWLAAFAGQVCRKHPELDLVPLLQFVANQLKDGQTLDLLLLQEMLTAMTVRAHALLFFLRRRRLHARGSLCRVCLAVDGRRHVLATFLAPSSLPHENLPPTRNPRRLPGH